MIGRVATVCKMVSVLGVWSVAVEEDRGMEMTIEGGARTIRRLALLDHDSFHSLIKISLYL